jgi:hypothetical protein
MKKLTLITLSIFAAILVLLSCMYGCGKDEDDPVSPVVISVEVFGITSTTAYCHGEIVSDGGAEIIEKGACWRIYDAYQPIKYPTIGGDRTKDGKGNGSFVSKITGLYPNTSYTVRTYAINAAGTRYGSEIYFHTLP